MRIILTQANEAEISQVGFTVGIADGQQGYQYPPPHPPCEIPRLPFPSTARERAPSPHQPYAATCDKSCFSCARSNPGAKSVFSAAGGRIA